MKSVERAAIHSFLYVVYEINLSKFKKEIASYFHKVKQSNLEFITVNVENYGGYGRVKTRICRQLRVVNEWITEAAEWKGIQTVIEVKRKRYN